MGACILLGALIFLRYGLGAVEELSAKLQWFQVDLPALPDVEAVFGLQHPVPAVGLVTSPVYPPAI